MNGLAISGEAISNVSPDNATAGGAAVVAGTVASVVGALVGAAVEATAPVVTGVVGATVVGCVAGIAIVVATDDVAVDWSSSSPHAARMATAEAVASQGATRRRADLGRDMGSS